MEDFKWIFQFLGRLHPLIVHFPIGLLVVGFILELATIGPRRKGLREGINWMVYIGAISAIIGALFGWLLRTNDDYSGELVEYHQYLGIATGLLASITTFLLIRKMKNNAGSYIPYRISLALTVACLIIAGHLGANLTHGEDFLSSALPGNNNSRGDGNAARLLAELSLLDSFDIAQKDRINLEVRKIFAHNCYQCHSENKKKGDLVLENKVGVYKGGKNGPILVAGKPNESELYRRITLSPNNDDVMPKKGKVLTKSEVALIRLWIENGAHWSDQVLKLFPEAPLALSKPDLPRGNEKHPVDRLIGAYFERNAIAWPEVVDDRTFVRRVYLDIIGLLPEPQEIDKFLVDPDPDKRRTLIDFLLNDSTNYTEHWLSFWNDLLRNDYTGTGFITGGRKQITDWLYTSLKENKPYHLMVKELVDPNADSEGFIKGIKWRGVVNSSQRTEMQAAQNIGQSLLGINVKCASCHNSFVSNLTLEESYGFASIFSDSVLELNRCDKPLGKLAKAGFLYPELGEIAAESKKERLSKLSEVIVKSGNGRLYRTITNRFWHRLMGRGIVEPVDEMDNVPWEGTLLDWLAADFIDSGYDLKHLLKMIMTSKAYQLPTVSYRDAAGIKNDFIFHGPTIRRMSAEEFSDAVSQVITPMYAAVAYSPTGGELSPARIWHRELKFDRDVLPEPGKRYFRRTFNLANRSIQSANVLISVDHSYILYINGKNIAKGTDWKKVDKLEVSDYLSAGKNCIAIEGFNDGSIANPAGISFAMKIDYGKDNETMIEADTHWKSTAVEPHEDWVGIGFDDSDWDKVRDYGSSNWGNLVNFTFNGQARKFARASLVPQHSFMLALGRPSRENVATTRDDQPTLLQALELTNGAFFNQVLSEGAEVWLRQYGPDSERIVEELYQRSLGRQPTQSERETMLGVLGGQVSREALQDVFWATLNLPEFQFIN
jgi:uncharacterized membrane protein/mono/diheme cytochrome c family protein